MTINGDEEPKEYQDMLENFVFFRTVKSSRMKELLRQNFSEAQY